MLDGKRALAEMTPMQILAMSALGQAPAILGPMLKLSGVIKPPYNLIISNVPGPRTTQYFNGMKLEGTYPLSIPIDGMALNITCKSYADQMAFGLTGCRRTVPRLQRLLIHLDTELSALEKAVGV
jgi:diacylglycerol O-acyltransferase